MNRQFPLAVADVTKLNFPLTETHPARDFGRGSRRWYMRKHDHPAMGSDAYWRPRRRRLHSRSRLRGGQWRPFCIYFADDQTTANT